MCAPQNQGFHIWPKSCDHKICTDIGWFLYSLHQQDDQCLAELLSELIQEPIGLKWKQIRTTTGYVKRDPNDTSEKEKPYMLKVLLTGHMKFVSRFPNFMVWQQKFPRWYKN